MPHVGLRSGRYPGEVLFRTDAFGLTELFHPGTPLFVAASTTATAHGPMPRAPLD